eukprot:TRINITY_DN827_c0_g2_i2.p1 TRINITY_DN827_c0_g2~~TRINITY_DN827_c0_g2_i2.p1  ORF type:complete len:104 (-),score=18.14 TRINITY_DN827_c0_g2_i2:80-391(-)
MPGLFISFAFSMDKKLRPEGKPFYFVISVVAYVIGLGLTYLSLFLMNSAQPALLYLVPCTLISVTVASALRGEFWFLWGGESHLPFENPQHHNSDEELSDSVA